MPGFRLPKTLHFVAVLFIGLALLSSCAIGKAATETLGVYGFFLGFQRNSKWLSDVDSNHD